MPIQIYRYQRIGVRTNQALQNESDATALTTGHLPDFTDISIDDSRVADLDAFMADLGYANVATNPATMIHVEVEFGEEANPAYTFTGDLDTGLYSPAPDTVAFTTAGTERLRVLSDGTIRINKTGIAAGALSQAPSFPLRYTASTWTGAAEAERDWNWYGGVTTAFDESAGVVSRMVLDYEGQNVLEIRPTANAPGAPSGVVFRNRRADGINAPPFTFITENFTAGADRILFRIGEQEAAEPAAPQIRMQITSAGGLQIYSNAPVTSGGVRVLNDAGVFQYGLEGNNGAAQFGTILAFQIYSQLAAGATPLAEILTSGPVWGAGQPVWAIRRDNTNRIYQLDGDALVTHIGRITGTTGPEYRFQHLDGEVGVVDDVLVRLSGWGADNTTPATMRNYGEVRLGIQSAAVGAVRGYWGFYTPTAGVQTLRFSVQDTQIQQETSEYLFNVAGTVYVSKPGTSPFVHRIAGNVGAAAAWQFNDENTTTLLQIDGDGDAVVTKDIEAVGGYRSRVGSWNASPAGLLANQPETVLAKAGTSVVGNNDWVATRAGSITGFAAILDAAVTAGTLTINIRINATIVWTIVVSATETTSTQAKDADAFVAGDNIDMSYTTTLVFTGPSTIDAEIEVET